ncbi:RNA polymerase sigma factor [Streptomyces chiangmaiensis]|uniref:RNA polymerase sigma factor n=1 Tax=Streptomyces chiangmaiensis TaxID=766497 RepID=UPI0031EAC8AC
MVGYTRNALRWAGVPESYVGAEDVVQNAFAKAYRDPGRVMQPRAYVYQLIRHEVREHADRWYRVRGEGVERPVPAADCAEAVVARCDVQRALVALPAQQRSAVYATKGLAFSQAEVAEAMGKRPGTVGVHVARAVATLKATLAAVTVLAAVLLCGAGAETVRRYSAASRGGGARPELPDPAQPMVVSLWTVGTAYACVLLGFVVLLLALYLRHIAARPMSRTTGPADAELNDRLHLGYKPPTPASAAGAPEYCPECGQTTMHLPLTELEKHWFRKKAWEPKQHDMKCTQCGKAGPVGAVTRISGLDVAELGLGPHARIALAWDQPEEMAEAREAARL